MRKGLTISAIGHLVVVGFGLVAFTGKPFDHVPQESLPVDIISADQLSQMTRGTKTGAKNAPAKPVVEKVAPEEKPVEDTKPQISERKEIETAAAPDKPPVPQDKPLEKQPDIKPEPVKDKPKEEPKKVEAKEDKSEVDPIAEALKKEKEKAEKPKPVATPRPRPKAASRPAPKPEQKFDADRIAALLDKRTPRRNAATGQELNATASMGTQTGQAKSLTLSWVNALQARIAQCWNVPAGVRDAEEIKVRIYFELNRDGTVAGQPQLIGGSPSQFGPSVGESGIRAIQQCQPYNFLPQNEYAGGWDKLDITFSSKDMFRQ